MYQCIDSDPGQVGAERALIIHAGESWYSAVLEGKFDFFRKLEAKASAQGLRCYAVAAEHPASVALIALGHHIHLVIGPRGPVGPGVWHVHPSYLRGFWYCDPLGVNMASSLKEARFDPASVDPARGRWFFNGVRGWHLGRNLSKFPQTARAEAALPPAAAVVYLQEIERFRRPVHWLDGLTMLRVAAETAKGARVYVKLHPAQEADTVARVRALAADWPNVVISAASIHDLTAAATVVVTQNSAAGFEALLQKKPVITCAESDYHAATLQARDAASLAQALTNAPARLADFPYERFLYWFLGENQFEAGKPEFEARIWARLTAGPAGQIGPAGPKFSA